MAKNNNRISVNALERIFKEQKKDITTIEWQGETLEIKHTLGLADMLGFVNDIVESCFGEDDQYLPEVMDFAVKCGILTKYANLTLPKNLELRYDIIYNTDAVQTVYDSISTEQLSEIVESARRKIKCRRDTHISAVHQRLSEVATAFEEMKNNMDSLFSKVSGEEIGNFLETLTKSNLDEENVVKAYLKAKSAKNPEFKLLGDTQKDE